MVKVMLAIDGKDNALEGKLPAITGHLDANPSVAGNYMNISMKHLQETVYKNGHWTQELGQVVDDDAQAALGIAWASGLRACARSGPPTWRRTMRTSPSASSRGDGRGDDGRGSDGVGFEDGRREIDSCRACVESR